MTALEIIKKYLVDRGFDGLHSFECGCLLDDLVPCCPENLVSCEPGYKQVCNCGDHEFHVGEIREPTP